MASLSFLEAGILLGGNGALRATMAAAMMAPSTPTGGARLLPNIYLQNTVYVFILLNGYMSSVSTSDIYIYIYINIYIYRESLSMNGDSFLKSFTV